MATASDHLLGRLAVHHGYASEDQVRACMETRGAVTLIDSLEQRGHLDAESRRRLERDLALIQFVRAEKAFARIAVQRGVLDKDAAARLLERQRSDGYRWRVGEALLREGTIDEATRDRLAEEQIRWLEQHDATSSQTGSGAHALAEEAGQALHESSQTAEVPEQSLQSFQRDSKRYSSDDAYPTLNAPAPPPPPPLPNLPAPPPLPGAPSGRPQPPRPPVTPTGSASFPATPPSPPRPPVAPGQSSGKIPAVPQPPRSTGRVPVAPALPGSSSHRIPATPPAHGSSSHRIPATPPAPGSSSHRIPATPPAPGSSSHRIPATPPAPGSSSHRIPQAPAPPPPPPPPPPPGPPAQAQPPAPMPKGMTMRLSPKEGSLHETSEGEPEHVIERTMQMDAPSFEDPPFERTMQMDAPTFDDPPFERTMQMDAPTFDDPVERTMELTAPPSFEPEPAFERTMQLEAPEFDGVEQPSQDLDGYKPGETLLVDPPDFSEARNVEASADSGPVVKVPVEPLQGSSHEHTVDELDFLGPNANTVPMHQALPPPGSPVMDPNARTMPIPQPEFPEFDPASTTPPTEDQSVEMPGPAVSSSFMDPNAATQPVVRPDLEDGQLIGCLLSNRYMIQELLGQGGMGTVFKAEHTLMGRTVAIKVLNRELVKSEESIARFKREIMAMAQFQHPNVVRVFDAGTTAAGRFYMAMEYVPGQNLTQVLRQKTRLGLEEFAEIFTQILLGLGEGHKRSIVHRDLKTENIQLSNADNRSVVKIMDFGIAKLLGGQPDVVSQSNQFVTTERMAVGTPEYMSPEQASGGAQVDHRSDIYSLGVMAFELLTGKLPFEADSPVGYIGKHIIDPPLTFEEACPGLNLPPDVERWVLKALEKDPSDRYESASEMLDALQTSLPGSASEKVATTRRFKAKSLSGSGDALDGGGGGGGNKNKTLVLLMAGLLAVALLVGTAIVGLVVLRPSSAADRVAAIEAEVEAARKQQDWTAAKAPVQALIKELGEDDAGPARELLARVEESEELVSRHDANQAAIRTGLEAVKNATAYGQARAALDELKAHVQEALEIREKLSSEDVGLGAVCADDPLLPEIAELEADLEPLKSQDAVKTAIEDARNLMRQDEFPGAQNRLSDALKQSTDPEQQAQIKLLLAEAETRNLMQEARRFLDREEPDYEAAIAALKKAQKTAEQSPAGAHLPSQVTNMLQDAEAGRQDASSVRSRTEVKRLIDRAEFLAGQGKLDEALSSLAEAERLRQQKRVADTWDLPKRRARLKAAKASLADYQALPAVGADTSLEDLRAGLAARKSYVEKHPEGHKVDEVRTAIAEVEKRLSEGQDAAKTQAFEAKLKAAREAYEAGKLTEATKLAAQACSMAGSAGLDDAEAKALQKRIKVQVELAQRLKTDYALMGKIYISRYEVSRLEYWKFCRKLSKEVPADKVPWPEHWSLRADKSRVMPKASPGVTSGSLPVGGVSRIGAEAYCEYMTKTQGVRHRLPTKAEWEQAACGGKTKRKYPWGDAWDASKAILKTDEPIAVRGDAAKSLGGASPLGLLHMAGNIAEWVSDTYEDDDGEDPSSGIVMGGSYRSFSPAQLEIDQDPVRASVSKSEPWIGFRVVIDPE